MEAARGLRPLAFSGVLWVKGTAHKPHPVHSGVCMVTSLENFWPQLMCNHGICCQSEPAFTESLAFRVAEGERFFRPGAPNGGNTPGSPFKCLAGKQLVVKMV